jgi:hypothetical protein
MKRTATTLGIGGAILAAALLAACGGGGGLQSAALPSAGAAGNNPATHTSGTRITLRVPRGTSKTRHTALHGGAHRSYVSIDAQGLQIAISSTGSNATTTTEFVDISSTSPLCTPLVFGTTETTCSFTIPTVAANETIVATEVDQTPTNENATTGFGTGFSTSTNILAVGTTSVAVTGGVTNVSLGLNPVAAQLFDCGDIANPNFGTNFVSESTSRIVVTAGVVASGQMFIEFEDAADGFVDVDPTPLPFVDVNGSPTPITLNSLSSAVTLAVVPNPVPAATPPLAQTVSIPNDGFDSSFENCLTIDVNVSANLTAPATISVKNNLTATNPISVTAPYPAKLTYTVVPISVAPATATVAVGAATTATVTGSDFEGTSGMFATPCVDTANPSQNDATVSANGQINTDTWQEAFTITPTMPGTCTFTLGDSRTGVVTTPVTVTVNP